MGAALRAFALGPAEDGVKGQAGRGREAGGKAAGARGVEVAVDEEAICRELKIQATFRKHAPRWGRGRVIGWFFEAG